MIKKILVVLLLILLVVALLPIVTALSAIAGVCLYLLFSGMVIILYWADGELLGEQLKAIVNDTKEQTPEYEEDTDSEEEEVIEIVLPHNEVEN